MKTRESSRNPRKLEKSRVLENTEKTRDTDKTEKTRENSTPERSKGPFEPAKTSGPKIWGHHSGRKGRSSLLRSHKNARKSSSENLFKTVLKVSASRVLFSVTLHSASPCFAPLYSVHVYARDHTSIYIYIYIQVYIYIAYIYV